MNAPPTAAATNALTSPRSRKRTVLAIVGVFLLGCGLAAGATAWWVKRQLYAGPLKPVSLNAAEQQALDVKLATLRAPATAPRQPAPEEVHRTLIVSQKEINACLAERNLGEQVQVELGHDRIMATVLLPVPKDAGVPLVSGTTIRLMFAMEAGMAADKKLALKVKDVRVCGISMPNAWLGQIKGVDLVAESVEQDPMMQQFLAGIEEVEIRPEGLRVLLSE